MAMPSSSDADVTSSASADDSESSTAGFCCMHVIETRSRVIPLGEKSFKKFKECANLWKKAENTPESKIALNADRYDWDCVQTPIVTSFSEEQGIDDREQLCDNDRDERSERTIEGDDFTGKLFKIYQQVHDEKLTKDIELGLLRSDYMLDTARGESSNMALSMVEMNTMAASFAGLASNVVTLHRFVLGLCNKQYEPSCLPDNLANQGMAEAMVKAFHLYGQPSAAIVFIVTFKEANIFDQRLLEYAITECDQRVKVIRRTLGDIGRRGELTKDRRLFIDGVEVAVLYYRFCYTPNQFPTEFEWKAKLMGEQSRAVVCPSISWHLTGTKKVQQELAKPGVLEQFVENQEVADFIRSSFAGLYSLDLTAEGDEAARRGIENPKRYVMKPQREGGGNNTYDDEVRTTLEKLAGNQEREAYILMDRILPPIHQNYLQPCGGFDDLKLSKVISELGIYGMFVSHNGEVVLNESKGHLLRTKHTSENEGSVAAGASCLDSPFLT